MASSDPPQENKAYFAHAPLRVGDTACLFCGFVVQPCDTDMQIFIIDPQDYRAAALYKHLLSADLEPLRFDGAGVHPIGSLRLGVAHNTCYLEDEKQFDASLEQIIVSQSPALEYKHRIKQSSFVQLLATTYQPFLRSLTVLSNEPWVALTAEQQQHYYLAGETRACVPPSWVMKFAVHPDQLLTVKPHDSWPLTTFVDRLLCLKLDYFKDGVNLDRVKTCVKGLTMKLSSVRNCWVCASIRNQNPKKTLILVVHQAVDQVRTVPPHLTAMATDWVPEERKWALFEDQVDQIKTTLETELKSTPVTVDRWLETSVSSVVQIPATPKHYEFTVYVNSAAITTSTEVVGLFNGTPFFGVSPTVAMPVIAAGGSDTPLLYGASQDWGLAESATAFTVL